MGIRRGERRPDWRTVGEEPDERFSFANERTFLAWNRTALALVTAGLAITQILPELPVSGGRRIIGLPLIGLGILVAGLSYREWAANERALRLKAQLPHSPLPWLVSAVVTVTAAIALVLAALDGGS
ncbi:MAG TPA: DUF202 domain-containing protein [Acidimicrobiales bacterium]|nr:DUF202 domain-containing protein [Acidimicrobiales bacterium]